MTGFAVFPGSIPNQNNGIFGISRFNTKSKQRDLQYFQVQYQIKTTGFAVFPGSIPNQNDVFFFQAEDGIRDLVRSRGLGDVYKRQSINGDNKF